VLVWIWLGYPNFEISVRSGLEYWEITAKYNKIVQQPPEFSGKGLIGLLFAIRLRRKLGKCKKIFVKWYKVFIEIIGIWYKFGSRQTILKITTRLFERRNKFQQESSEQLVVSRWHNFWMDFSHKYLLDCMESGGS